MRVIVIGAGVIGASIGRSLALSGAEVLLIDRWKPGSGTSSTTFAWVNANRKPDPHYFTLHMKSIEEYGHLMRELPGAPAYFQSGGLQLANADNEHDLVANVDRLRGLGYPVRWVGDGDVQAIAGEIRVPNDTTRIAHFPIEGYVRPDRLVENLVADALRHGAKLQYGEVVSIDDSPGNVSVALTSGDVRRGDRIIMASGRWTDSLAGESGFAVPMVTNTNVGSPINGLLGYIPASTLNLRCVVHTPRLNLRPGGGTDIVLHARDISNCVDVSNPSLEDGNFANAISARLAEVAPSYVDMSDLTLRVAIRSMPADGFPIVGYTSPHATVYSVVSHSGVSLAPVLGRLVAREILTDESLQELAPYRPSRFDNIPVEAISRPQLPARMGEQ